MKLIIFRIWCTIFDAIRLKGEGEAGEIIGEFTYSLKADVISIIHDVNQLNSNYTNTITIPMITFCFKTIRGKLTNYFHVKI